MAFLRPGMGKGEELKDETFNGLPHLFYAMRVIKKKVFAFQGEPFYICHRM